MFVKEFEVEDIGRHAHVKRIINSPVVGILGKNHSGKTTLLEYLGFLFTGDLRDVQESYCRNFGKPGAAANGWGRAVFKQHGQEWEIFRQVGTSPRRWLRKVGSKDKVKGAKEIEKILNELLGSNRKAMSDSIFIPQGSLDKLFFGIQSEREEMFVRILQLGGLEKIVSTLEAKIQFVSTGLQDLTVLADEIAKQRNIVEAELAELNQQFRASQDWSSDLAALRKYQTLITEADTWIRQAEQYAAQQVAATTAFNTLMATPLPVNGVDEVFVNIADISNVLSMARNKLTEAITAHTTQAGYEAVLSKHRLHKDQVATVEARLIQKRGELAALAAFNAGNADEVDRQAQAIIAWNGRSKAQTDAQNTMLAAGEALSQFNKNNVAPDQKAIDDLDEQLRDTRDKYSRLKLIVDTQSVVVGGKQIDICPACERSMEGHTFNHAALEAHKQDLAILEAAGKEKAAALKKLQEYQRWFSSEQARVTSEASAATLNFTKAVAATGAKPPGDVVQLQFQAKQIRDAQAQTAELEKVISVSKVDLVKMQEMLAAIPADKLAEAQQNFHQDTLAKQASQVADLKESIRRLEERLKTVQPAFDKIGDAQRLENEATAHQVKKAQEAHVIEATFTPQLISVLHSATAELSAEQILEAKVAEYQALAGRVQQARANADAVKKRQHELADKEEADAVKRGIIKDLRSLHNTFSRGGLPMRYVRHKFSRLAELTRKSLTQLDADFTITVDPNVSVSLNFTQIDEADPYVMPQNKLSGGQRVRLSIAFLMAVQKEIVPEIAFLVLDEPSLHLDADGRENLRDLLANMGPQLGNSESQIWVCDHAPELASALGSIIQL